MKEKLVPFLLSLALGCTSAPGPGASSRTEAPEQPEAPAQAAPAAPPQPKAARLTSAGECRANGCTLHVAQVTDGDAETFTGSRCAVIGPTCGVRAGKLTESARSKLRALAARLENEKLEPRYGCPGCADGPVSIVVLHRANGSESKHVLDPLDVEKLPAPLRETSQLLEELSSKLGTCTASEHLTIAADCTEQRAKDEKTRIGIP